MRKMVREKERVIALRKSGLTYKEIAQQVPVSKSSISDWLKDCSLTDSEKTVLKKHTNSNISRGRIRAAAALRDKRLKRDQVLFSVAKQEFEASKHNPLFLTGISLYWAEGSKRQGGFAFTNSDSDMVRVMLLWMKQFLGLHTSEIRARLYIHKPYAHEQCEEYWAERTGIPRANFGKTIYKPTGLLIKKRPNYKGCLRIETGKTAHLRKMLFWTNMMVEYYREK
ncbi:helix-turn-helix domain-containing protein [Candidatus Kaiserbacteria bacterium]|nr:helix-turn-helix domain-containing protein [Candidatus Kaiserbacteria bacterium]